MAHSAPSSAPKVLRLELACDLAQVRPAARAVRRYLHEQGCREQEIKDCDIALVEACNNAILHTGPAGQELPIRIEARVRAREIELRVTDHTPGFAWPQPAQLPDADAERGRGIYLIQAVMDSAHYTRNGPSNALVLKKTRA